MKVTRAHLLDAIDQLDPDTKIVCIHSSLRSFGYVEGGARAIVNAFLERGYTILVPTFSYDYIIEPPKEDRPPRNGFGYRKHREGSTDNIKIFNVHSNAIEKTMGAIPYEILNMTARQRGYNPINSFTAIGEKAYSLVEGQSSEDVYAPLKKLYELDGHIILMGLSLTSMTALHLAEELSGRNLFIRWAKDPHGKPIRVRVGSCSNGFDNFKPVLKDIEKRLTVGKSLWRIFPMRETMDLASAAIKGNQWITYCGDPDCERCRDAIQGGPIL